MKVNFEVNNEILQDVLCSAFEGGSNYWYEILKSNILEGTKIEKGIKQPVEYYHEVPFRAGGYIVIGDLEDGKLKFKLTYNKIKKGVQIMATKYPRHLKDMITEKFDATTADVFLQCCVFGDVIYG